MMVADLIRGFVREDWVSSLDFDTLERVSEISISQDLRKAGEIPARGPLPPVLPIVLYNGHSTWSAATSLAQLIDPDLPEQLQHWQPCIRYLLLDEQRFGDSELAGLRNVAAALFRLENSRQPEDIERVLTSLVDWLQTPEQDGLRRAFVVWLKRVLLPARVPNADMDTELPNIIELQEMQTMLAERVKTWAEEWKQQGLEQGLEQGREQGLEQGIERGVPLGEAKLLRRQLTRRFGPLPHWVQQRLEHATEAELESWADRVLESRSLDEIFARST